MSSIQSHPLLPMDGHTCSLWMGIHPISLVVSWSMQRRWWLWWFASPCTPPMHFKVSLNVSCGAYPDQTHFCVALDVVGFSRFKHHYETQMEEQASMQLGRITKEEFLMMIVEPYHKAFTPENVKKSYETTGIWPVNWSKITADKIGPAEGLSHYSSPIVALSR